MDWQITGQEWAADLLSRHVARGGTRHAYLFCGPPGVGRRSLAVRLAQALNCEQPPAPGQPCLVCRTCQQFERMQHPDLSIVQSEPDSNSIKVDPIREVQRSLSLSPYAARYRVAMLLNFEQATASAQNALLKTLEEAPEKVILLLTADSPENLLPTIVSRCEVLRLRPMPVEDLQAALQTRWQMDAQRARLLAHLSGGRPGYALRLKEQEDILKHRARWLEQLHQAVTGKRQVRFKIAEALSGNKDTLRSVFQVWLSFWRDLLLLTAGADTPLTNLDYEDDLRMLALQVDFDLARARVTALEQALAGLDANLNARLLTEVLLLDWPVLHWEFHQPEPA